MTVFNFSYSLKLSRHINAWFTLIRRESETRDATFRKMANQYQTDTNEMAATKKNTKPIFIRPRNTNI